MSHKPAWLIEADKLRPDVQVIVEHSGPSRSMRRAALKTLRHNTVLYHAEMDRVREKVSARNEKTRVAALRAFCAPFVAEEVALMKADYQQRMDEFIDRAIGDPSKAPKVRGILAAIGDSAAVAA